jgi:class 3 adenylate cyclase/tetratricopeptide (TPR) repeat protein
MRGQVSNLTVVTADSDQWYSREMDTLRIYLERHGLGKYTELFIEHSIDIDVLADLTETDLEKLGMPLGDRRRFLKAVPSLVAVDVEQEMAQGREAERRQLTVMFADLVDSTKLAARFDPEDMKDVIARYQKAVSDKIIHFGGYVAKPLGDGLLIYFGWPQAHEDDALRALRSAKAAIDAVRGLMAPDDTALAARIGIATGEVVVGDFTGAGVDEKGAVVGETPNLAARLQAVASENSVVVAEKTRRLVGRQFAFADLGEQQLKGFDRPIRAWRVDGELASQSRFDAMHGDRLGAFIGREHEIGMLMQRWEDARDSECQLVLVAGEAGIGKSRLVSECVSQLTGKTRRITCQGSPLHTNTAFYPVVQYLQTRAGFANGDTAAERWIKLDGAVQSQSPRRRIGVRFLSELMSLEIPDDGGAEPKPGVAQSREAAFEVVADTLKSETDHGPLLMVVEDAHWLDPTTQEFVGHLLSRLQHCRAMVLVTYRPEFVPPWERHANVGLLSLNRLGRRDTRAIVASMAALDHDLPPEIAEDIVAKSDGIPLFVEELAGSAIEAARETGDRRIQIPATLRDSLSERLDRLGPTKEVAQIAAAFGREFAADLVAATLRRPENELEADIDRLIAVDIVFESSRSGRRYTFRHGLLQEAAYESMLKSKRRGIHARIAEVLSQYRPEMIETEPEVLAAHFGRAGDTGRSAECWQSAGRLALRNSAYREAIGAFNNALSLLPEATKARADTSRAIASAYFAAGDHNSVHEHLENAASDAEAADDQVMMAEIAMQQSHDLIHYGGSVTDAVRFGERALEIATQLDDDALAYGARFSLGQATWMGGNFIASKGFLTANLPENLRDPKRVRDFGTAGSLMTDSLALLGAICAYVGEFDRAFTFIDRAGTLATDSAFDISVVQYHLNRAQLHRGDIDIALPLGEASVRHATEASLKFVLPWLEGNLGHALALTGRVEEAISMLEKAAQDSDAMHQHQPAANVRAHTFLAETLVAGNPVRALESAEDGLKIARANGYRAQEAELLRVKAAAIAMTDPPKAKTPAREGLALARTLAMRPEEGHALRVLADIHTSGGEVASGRENRDRARAIYTDLGMTYWVERVG